MIQVRIALRVGGCQDSEHENEGGHGFQPECAHGEDAAAHSVGCAPEGFESPTVA